MEGRGRKKRGRRKSSGSWRIRKGRPADGTDGEGGRKTSAGNGRKRGRVRERSGEVLREGVYHVKELGTSGRREFAVERLLREEAGERVVQPPQGGGVLPWGYGC